MRIKAILLMAAAVLSIGTASLAKDKGTMTKFPNWGIITVPDDIYMQSGRQPMLTAADEGNDVIALFEKSSRFSRKRIRSSRKMMPISSTPICCTIRRRFGMSKPLYMGRTGKIPTSAISAAGRICGHS